VTDSVTYDAHNCPAYQTHCVPPVQPPPPPHHDHTNYPPATTIVNNIDNSNSNNNTNNNTVTNNITNNTTSNSSATATAVAQAIALPIQYQIQYVQQPTYYSQQSYYQRPYCTISLSGINANGYSGYGQMATLSWSSQNAVSAYISPNVGSVSGYGSMQVYPTNGQTYSMTVYGQGGNATCQTQAFYAPVYVAPRPNYLPLIPAPIAKNPPPYVSLSQIPYTGFGAGGLSELTYWLSVMAFASAALYLLLYYKGKDLLVSVLK
jgi:hypothetical protein